MVVWLFGGKLFRRLVKSFCCFYANLEFFLTKKTALLFEPYLCLLAAAFVRLWHLDFFSLWFDECLPLLVQPADLAARVGAGQFYLPVVYAVFAKYVLGPLGSDFLIRLPSAVLGVASVFVGRRCCGVLFSQAAARLFGWFAALCPFYVYYSQDSRMYSMAGFLALCGVYFWGKALRQHRHRFHFGFVTCFVLNLYVLNFTFLLYVCLAGLMLYRYHTKFRRYVFRFWLWQSVFLVMGLPFFWSVFRAFAGIAARQGRFYNLTFAWIPKVGLPELFFSFKNFLFGFNASAQVFGGLVVLCLGVAIWGGYRMRKCRGFEVVSCAVAATAPVFAVFAVSSVYPCYQDKYFFAGSFFLWFLIAAGLAKMPRRAGTVLSAVVLVGLLGGLVQYYRGVLPENPRQRRCVYERRDCRGALEALERNVKPGELVYFSSNSVLPTFEYYTRQGYFKPSLFSGMWLFYDRNKGEGVRAYFYDTTYRKVWNASESAQPGVQQSFWVVHSPWGNDFAHEKTTPAGRVIGELEKHFNVSERIKKQGMELYRFHAPRD